ncbi:hypothetical protein J5N97_026331 [Dioscorea zingiberensis]|uniref:UBX domain-containing protein n=1 Tax=Dioscorea zingiberensis TaxID=325984 RepID=A0A9D5H6M0_9LILI|nr:hypothetical protein J5N97_026331 [Dioscorea zingiberensis]
MAQDLFNLAHDVLPGHVSLEDGEKMSIVLPDAVHQLLSPYRDACLKDKALILQSLLSSASKVPLLLEPQLELLEEDQFKSVMQKLKDEIKYRVEYYSNGGDKVTIFLPNENKELMDFTNKTHLDAILQTLFDHSIKTEGPVSPEELVEILQRTIEEQGSAFRASRESEEETLRRNRRLREEQDAAYHESLLKDKIRVRFPNGERREKSFDKTDKIRSIYKFIDSLDIPGIGGYQLISSFPRKVYGHEQLDMTIKGMSLHPSAALFLELI